MPIVVVCLEWHDGNVLRMHLGNHLEATRQELIYDFP